LFLLLTIIGCAEAKYYPVRGIIVDETGKPFVELEGAAVSFEAVGQPVSAVGEVGPDAKFVMTTEIADDGCLPGEHRVVISPQTSDGDLPLPRVIHSRYERLETSGITVTVKKERNQTIKIEIPRLGSEPP
jgi:hypothetical protein